MVLGSRTAQNVSHFIKDILGRFLEKNSTVKYILRTPYLMTLVQFAVPPRDDGDAKCCVVDVHEMPNQDAA